MDFMNRGSRATQSPTHHPESEHTATPTGSPKGSRFKGKWSQAIYIGFSIAVVVLIAAVLASVLTSNGGKKESDFVDKGKLQAVFLNGGQVYFGKVTDLNRQYLKMSNIYYLRVNQQVQPEQNKNNNNTQNDISLVKLGCELHGPQDDMVINREQVVFWENLKGDGQVAKAVDEYVKQNPNGQKCQTTNNNTNSTTNSNQ